MPDDVVWTLDGDETSWSEAASARAEAVASPLVREVIATHQASHTRATPGWALDLGCGTGRAFPSLAEAGYRVLGVDPTAQAVAIAHQRATREGWPAWPLQASAARLPLADGVVGLLLAVGVLFHLSARELAAALGEVRRVLQPAGRAVLHFLDADDWRASLASRIEAGEAPVPAYRAIVTCFASERPIRRWLQAAGLEILSLELRTSASDGGELRNWIITCRRREEEGMNDLTDGILGDERLARQIRFLVETEKLKSVLRRTFVVGADRYENSAEHSWQLPVAALILAEYAGGPLDLPRVLKMLLVHDIIEIDAGDTYCYDEQGALDKAEREGRAAERIFGLLPGEQAAEIHRLWIEFEAGATAEARFANAVDRLMPLLHNYYTQGRSWQEHGITADRVLERNAQVGQASDALGALVRAIVDAAVARGYLAPAPEG